MGRKARFETMHVGLCETQARPTSGSVSADRSMKPTRNLTAELCNYRFLTLCFAAA